MSAISSTWINGGEWTQISVPEDATNLVFKLHHSNKRDARLWIGAGSPPTDVNDPAMSVLHWDRPRTFSIEEGDAVYARIYSSHDVMNARLDLWAGDDS